MKLRRLTCLPEMMLLASLLLCAAPALAGETYFYGDGQKAFVLSPSLEGSPAEAPRFELQQGGNSMLLIQNLGIGGDVIFENAAGETVLRQKPGRAAIYYERTGSFGLPVLRGPDGSAAANLSPSAESYETLEDWAAAYSYKGRTVPGAKANADKTQFQPNKR